MIVIGASLGGIVALQTILKALPRGFAPPIAAVLHRQKNLEDALVPILREACALPISEPCDKEPIEAGHVYIAPADYHLLIEPGYFSLSIDAPVRYARPSIDVLFESAADACGSAVIGVVLTGANQDGAAGAARIAARGGRVIVQEPASAECAIMPTAALNSVRDARIASLPEIGALLARLSGPQ